MDVLYTEACSRVGLMKQKGNYVALPNDAYVEAGNLMLNEDQKTLLLWDSLNAPNKGNIMEASATLAFLTEPQQTVWVRHLLLQAFEFAHGKPLTEQLKKSHDWLDEPLGKDTHPHLFPLHKASP